MVQESHNLKTEIRGETWFFRWAPGQEKDLAREIIRLTFDPGYNLWPPDALALGNLIGLIKEAYEEEFGGQS